MPIEGEFGPFGFDRRRPPTRPHPGCTLSDIGSQGYRFRFLQNLGPMALNKAAATAGYLLGAWAVVSLFLVIGEWFGAGNMMMLLPFLTFSLPHPKQRGRCCGTSPCLRTPRSVRSLAWTRRRSDHHNCCGAR